VASSDEVVRRLFRFLAASDFLGVGVARRLALLDRLNQGAALTIEAFTVINELEHPFIRAAAAHRIAQQVDLLAQGPHVVHERSGSVLRDARRDERQETAVGVDSKATAHRTRYRIDVEDLQLGVNHVAVDRIGTRQWIG
jgi:hypothetical protein